MVSTSMTEDRQLIDPTVPIIGHEVLTSALTRSVGTGRLSHAWLITGSQGTGKSSMACLAAGWLLAEQQAASTDLLGGPLFDLNPNDPGTNLVIKGSHPDLLIVRPALEDNKSGQIKIDQIRAVSTFMAKKPGRGGWRVAIVDSLDAVNRNGINALLKILEEPPEKALLFLVASKPGRLPPTIRSRCRLVRVPPLAFGDCRQILEGPFGELPETQLNDLAILCDGAPGLAAELAECDAVSGYQALCSLLADQKLDVAALESLCDKLGRGGAAGQKLRSGIAILIARLLHISAVQASGAEPPLHTGFEQRTVKALASRHTAATLGEKQTAFVRQAAQADGLYLDYGLFLARTLGEVHQKTLP